MSQDTFVTIHLFFDNSNEKWTAQLDPLAFFITGDSPGTVLASAREMAEGLRHGRGVGDNSP